VSRPRISVVVPVYNVEKYLERCVDSIKNQTFKDLEIILVDDGSKDSSGRMCDELKETDKRIRVIHQANGGLGNARNSGLKAATGEYISFVDSDDYLALNTYEKLSEALKSTGAETCIFGFHRVKNGEIKFTNTNAVSGTFRGRDALENIFLNVLGSEPSCYNDFKILEQSSCFSLYSLDLIRKYNISYPPSGDFVSFSEDVLYNFDYYLRTSNVTVLNEAFYHYCQNPGTITTRYNENRWNLNVKLYKEQLRRAAAYIDDKDLLHKAEERMHRTFLAAARNCVMYISAFFTYKDGKRRIREICNDPVLQNVLKIYPWNKNPFKYRLFNFALKKRMLYFLYFLGKFKKK